MPACAPGDQVMESSNGTLKVADPEQGKFDTLLMGLDQIGCSLGFDKADKAKYQVRSACRQER